MKGDGNATAAGLETTSRESKGTLDVPWARFPSAQALAASFLHDGRFVARLDQGYFDCRFRRGKDEYLVVMLSGERDPQLAPSPRFERWSWGEHFSGSLLCVDDPSHALAPARLHTGWYVGTDRHNWQQRLVGLVLTVAAQLGVATRRVICCGSGAGGFAALMLAAQLKDATALVFNPDTNVLRCDQDRVADLLQICFSGRTPTALTPAERIRLSAAPAFRRSGAARCMVIQDADSTHATHFVPFCKALGIPTGGGTSGCGMRVAKVQSIAVDASNERTDWIESWIADALKLSALEIQSPLSMPPDDETLLTALEPGKALQPPLVNARQLYLIKNRRQPLRADGIEFLPRADVQGYEIKLPLDWSVDPFKDRNWCAQLHMWRLLDNHIFEYERSGDTRWLALPIAIIEDWNDFHVVRRKRSKFAWMDMVVGMRAMKIAFVLSAHLAGSIVLRDTQLAAFNTLVDRHLQFLLNPENLAYSNHTLVDMHGLAALGAVLTGPRKARIDAFLKQTMPKLIASQFDDAGVHQENSTGYQIFGIGCLRRLVASEWFGDYDVAGLLRRAQDVNEWFKMPDGRCVPIGDTDGAPMTGETACCFTATRQLLDTSGYVIFRDDGAGRCADATYLFFMAACNSRYHKQCDDLSFTWYEGEDIVCDTGKYGYKADEMHDYAKSARAHNTMDVDGDDPSGNITRRPDLVYGSAVKQAEVTEWGCVISGQVHHKPTGVLHTRHLVYINRTACVVIDRLAAHSSHAFTQWTHFSPHLAFRAAGRGHFVADLPGGIRLDAFPLVGAPAATLVRGRVEPVRQGWISQAYAELTPNDALGYTSSGESALFATILVLDDQGSCGRILADDIIEVDLRSRRGSTRLALLLSDTRCAVNRQPTRLESV